MGGHSHTWLHMYICIVNRNHLYACYITTTHESRQADGVTHTHGHAHHDQSWYIAGFQFFGLIMSRHTPHQHWDGISWCGTRSAVDGYHDNGDVIQA